MKYLNTQELEKTEVDQGDEEDEEEEGGKKKEEGEVEEEEDEIYDEEDIEEVSLYEDKQIIHGELIAQINVKWVKFERSITIEIDEEDIDNGRG